MLYNGCKKKISDMMESNQYDETKKRKFYEKCLLRYIYAYTNSLMIRASPFCSEEGIGGLVHLSDEIRL